MDGTYRDLARRVVALHRQKHDTAHSAPARVLIALSGPPGSGKTTIATEVIRALNELSEPPIKAVAVSIDGFHLPLATLRALPNATECLARRGAPWTFDGEAAARLVRTLRSSYGVASAAVPTFDHAVKNPVADGLIIGLDVDVCILEGNYLLCDEEPWADIAGNVDERWLVRVDEEIARQRVAARHLRATIEPTMEAALARADYNDIPNGRYVMQHSLGRQDVLVESVEEG
ncbi:Uu.00g104600.m01.CDS01 [Anthostomella pinea]|uniref:Uu.00g104600.m01.CDS01 n=1 Tax=Anthostomella pinea TaxID=933095 RepID=A0AAI8VDM3_9PEZI|nr:Uu.00g104600.m01.CDS01 [Anthostomella pinea]